MPAIVNISGHTAGDTWLGLSGNITLNGAPLDLTDAEIVMQIRRTKEWPSFAHEWSTASGTIQIPNPTGGQLYIVSGVVDVAACTYYYDVQISLNNGQVVTPIEGTWQIYKDVSR